jgi:hypothetical protein
MLHTFLWQGSLVRQPVIYHSRCDFDAKYIFAWAEIPHCKILSLDQNIRGYQACDGLVSLRSLLHKTTKSASTVATITDGNSSNHAPADNEHDEAFYVPRISRESNPARGLWHSFGDETAISGNGNRLERNAQHVALAGSEAHSTAPGRQSLEWAVSWCNQAGFCTCAETAPASNTPSNGGELQFDKLRRNS